MLAGGEGAGKSMGAAMEVIGQLTYWSLVYLVAPSFDQAKKEFEYITDALLKLGATNKTLISSPERGQKACKTVFGARVTTISSEEGTRAITGTGEQPDIIVMCEAGKNTHGVYLACLGRIARLGGRLILSGTFESSVDWYARLFNRWRLPNQEGGISFSIPTWENLELYPKGRDDERIKLLEATYPPDLFQERFGALPCPPQGLVFAEFDATKHVREDVTFNPELPVYLWIDPGYSGSHYAVEVVQTLGNTIFVIDEIYVKLALAHDVVKIAKGREWWGNVKGGVIDVAGRSHGLGMPSNVEVWNAAGVYLSSKYLGVEDGVLAHRRFLRDPLTGEPRIFLNPKCVGAIQEYQAWMRKELSDGLFGEPKSVGCDALKAINYGIAYTFGYVDKQPPVIDEQIELESMRIEQFYARLAQG